MPRAEYLEWRRDELAAAVRLARAGAREGDIFTREVAIVLRPRLDEAVRELELRAGDVLPAPERDEPWRPPLEVNGFFPWEAGPPRWRVLFWSLPPLPEELEYRLVGTDLIPLDAGARLVVDVLRDAVRHVPALRDQQSVPGFIRPGPTECGHDLVAPEPGS